MDFIRKNGVNMKTLLHCCCGPCLGGSYPILEKNIGAGNVAVFWENPNIHPYFEYIQRMNSFIKMADILGLNVYTEGAEYGLNDFLTSLNGVYGEERCATCYQMRLEATSKKAAENGFDAISTTLLISPYQNHDLLKTVGEKAAKKYNLSFNYIDFRPGFKDSYEVIRIHELYKQKYCGCVFSEYDRYKNDKKAKNTLKETIKA